MSLNAALVDLGRPMVDTPSDIKIEGSTQFSTVPGDWFKCRLTIQASPESDDPQGGRRRVARHATLLVGLKDKAHHLVAISPADKIEVSSKALGDAVWDVTEDPTPLRKKRKVIGWELTMVRVEEYEFATP